MKSYQRRYFDEGGPPLSSIGETDLLARLRAIARRSGSLGGLAVGPGDDAAVWRPPPGSHLVMSQDCLVEGIDFRREWIRPAQLGRRALIVALSDLAGMGARPAYCLATLCAPGSTAVDDVLALQEGLCAAAAAAACAVVGGDVSDIQGPLVMEVSVGGTIDPGAALRRDAGMPGDELVVTGVLGRAAAGLQILREPALRRAAGADAEIWVAAQLEPTARLAEGQALVELGIRCGGDLSDGLLAEASRTADASGCAAELWLDSVPVDPALATVFPSRWVDHALGGGEDFELLAAVAPAALERLPSDGAPAPPRLTVVGRLVEGSGLRLLDREGGPLRELPPMTSRHYG
ncbi:MAG: thiamine-phosphate kinase [Candidatus Dormibacteria bacterium]